MRKLLVVVLVVGLGALVYWKVLRASPEMRACERMQSLCGEKVDTATCGKELDEATRVLGDKFVDKATDCIDDAKSCVEALGCVVGAGTHLLDDFKRDLERARD